MFSDLKIVSKGIHYGMPTPESFNIGIMEGDNLKMDYRASTQILRIFVNDSELPLSSQVLDMETHKQLLLTLF